MTKKTPILTLEINEGGELFQVYLDHTTPVPLMRRHTHLRGDRENIETLCVILAKTVLERQGEETPKFPEDSHSALEKLWTIIRKTTKIDPEKPTWFQEIFGMNNPKKQGWVDGGQLSGIPYVKITKKLSVTVKYHTEYLRGRELTTSELKEMFTSFLNAKRQLKFNINILRGNKRRRINNTGEENFLKFKDRVQIRIKTNFPTHMVLYWVDCEKTCCKMFADGWSDFKVITPDFKTPDSGHRALKIPAGTEMMPLNTESSGSEIAILLLQAGKFTDHQLESIDKRISSFVKNIFFNAPIITVNRSSFLSRGLDDTEKIFQAPEQSFGAFGDSTSAELEGWKGALINNMSGLGDELVICVIPKREDLF